MLTKKFVPLTTLLREAGLPNHRGSPARRALEEAGRAGKIEVLDFNGRLYARRDLDLRRLFGSGQSGRS